MKIILLLIIFSQLAISEEITAIINVLEAPVFEEPDEDSRIVQYFRKGERIYLHPSTNKVTKYDHLRPEPISDREILDKTYDDFQREYPDKIFKKDMYNYDHNDLYVMTLTTRKRPGYILKKHISIQYNDQRELSEEKHPFDPTDYRIQEPLPQDYPFYKSTGYKGMFTLAFGPTTKSSYDYPTQKINDTSIISSEFQAVWSKIVDLGIQKRFFFGWIASLSIHKKNITLLNGSAEENWTSMGIGPYLSYDVWRNVKNTVTSFIGLNYLFLHDVEIDQSVGSDTTSAVFDGKTFTAKVGSYYKRKHVFAQNLDLTLGLNFNLTPPTKMNGNPDNTTGLWSDSDFTSKFHLDMLMFIGIQSDY